MVPLTKVAGKASTVGLSFLGYREIKMRKIISTIIIYSLLLHFLSFPVTGCSNDNPNENWKENDSSAWVATSNQNPGTDKNHAGNRGRSNGEPEEDIRLEEIMIRKVKKKLAQYNRKLPSLETIKKTEKTLLIEHELKKEHIETEYTNRYDQVLSYVDDLKEMKFNLDTSSMRIYGLISQIQSLNNLIKAKEDIRKISEQNFRQRLNSISSYLLLLGKRPQGTQFSENQVKEQIYKDMEDFLSKQWLIFEFNNTSLFGKKDQMRGQMIKKDTIFPDDREDTIKKNGIIYMYRIFRHIPFYIHEEEIPQGLDKVYMKLSRKTDLVDDIIGFKMKNKTSYDGSILTIDVIAGKNNLKRMMQFFKYQSLQNPEANAQFSQLLEDLEESNIKSLGKVNQISRDYSRKASKILTFIGEKKKKLAQLIKDLEDIEDFENSLDQLVQLAGKIYKTEPVDFIERIEDERKDIHKNIAVLIKRIEEEKDFQEDLDAVKDCFKRIIDEIDGLTRKLKQDTTTLNKRREFEFLEKGEQMERKDKTPEQNFIDAARDALSKLKKKHMRSSADIIVWGQGDNIARWTPRKFYKIGKIAALDVPFLYLSAIQTDAVFKKQDFKFFVYLKAKIIFDMREDFNIIDSGTYVKDSFNGFLWSKDTGRYVVLKGTSAQGAVADIIEQFHKGLTEEEKEKQPWTVAKRENLEILLHNEALFEALKIRLNRNYWTPKRIGIYYLTVKFRKNEKGDLELITEKRVASDGGYCILVRKLDSGGTDEK